jgi:hypothetical protein
MAVTIGATARSAEVLVVCPDEFRDAVAPWLEHRRGQGHTLEVLPSRETADALRQDIRLRAAPHETRFLVLLGDVADADETSAAGRRVPTFLVPAQVNTRWGSEPEIASDAPYADLDDDGAPDLAVGRVAADTADELRDLLDKTLDYERTAAGRWQTRINLIAGVGGFGAVADAALEECSRSLIAHGIPAAYGTTMTYASWRSPYCPDPRRFGEMCRGRLDEGCLFWVYIGHGQRRALDRVQTPQGRYPILTADDVGRLDCAAGPPVALFLACYTAAFDGPHDCLAEELLRAPRGPVAVLGGTRVTMPYAMAVLADGLMSACFVERCGTLGEALLAAQRGLLRTDRTDDRSQALDAVATLVSPAPVDLEAERHEHLSLFHLLGDPLLRLAYPEELRVVAPNEARPGDRLEIEAECPFDGQGTLELVCRRDRLTFEPPQRAEFAAEGAALAEYQAVYQRANNPLLASAAGQARGGRFRVELEVPSEARGPCHVRLYVETQGRTALGAADIAIRRPRRASED